MAGGVDVDNVDDDWWYLEQGGSGFAVPAATEQGKTRITRDTNLPDTHHEWYIILFRFFNSFDLVTDGRERSIRGISVVTVLIKRYKKV